MNKDTARKQMADAIREAGISATDAQIEKAADIFEKSVARFTILNRTAAAIGIAAAVVVAVVYFRFVKGA